MLDSEYRKVRAGAVVRTRTEMSNRFCVIPAGTEMTVVGKRNGFDLEGPKCSCCGVQAVISKVEAFRVDLVRF